MKIISAKLSNIVVTLLTHRWMQKGVTTLVILLILQTVFIVRSYQVSYQYLIANDPRNMQNRSELVVSFAPFRIWQGMKLKKDEIIAYLKELSYSENSDKIPGTYWSVENVIEINSRLPEYACIKLRFNKNQLEKIFIGEQPVNEVELEPLTMQNFIQFIGEDKAKELRIRRKVLYPGSVPDVVKDAVTSAEDNRFDEHFGLDWISIGKRTISSRFRDSGSGIVQQLIKKNIIQGAKEEFWQTYLGFLSTTLQRKIMEVPFSLAASELMSKDEILAAYLSMVPLGASNGIENHGFISAAQEYFGKTVDELNLAEAATLAGMINQPSNYLKFVRNGNRCMETEKKTCANLIERRNAVLGLMLRNHAEKYSPEIINAAQATPLTFVFSSDRQSFHSADYYSQLFADYAAQNLPEEVEKLREDEVNLRIFTSLDFQLQKQAMEIAVKNLEKLQPKLEADCKEQKKGKIDCSKVRLQMGIVAIEPQNGGIVTMIGGVNTQFNYAVKAVRSPASTVKPFYYLSAIETGFHNGEPFTAATIFDPDKDVINSGYIPTGNLGQRSSLRTFVGKSWNFSTFSAADSVGIENAGNLYARATKTDPEKTLMSAIGGTAGSETSLLNLTVGYSIFPNLGNLVEATPFRAISQNSKTIFLPEKSRQPLASIAGTFIVNDLLRACVEPGGTAGDFRQKAGFTKDVVFAGKTGSGMTSDLWFVGFTPKLLVGVWVGVPNNEIKLTLDKGWSGGAIAANVAAEYLRAVARFRPELLKGKFEPPANVVRRPIKTLEGCIDENSSKTEFFILGREPKNCEEMTDW